LIQTTQIRIGRIRHFSIVALIIAIRCASSFSGIDKFSGLQKQKISPRLEKGITVADVTTRGGKCTEACAEPGFISDHDSIRMVLAVGHLHLEPLSKLSFNIQFANLSRAPPAIA